MHDSKNTKCPAKVGVYHRRFTVTNDCVCSPVEEWESKIDNIVFDLSDNGKACTYTDNTRTVIVTNPQGYIKNIVLSARTEVLNEIDEKVKQLDTSGHCTCKLTMRSSVTDIIKGMMK